MARDLIGQTFGSVWIKPSDVGSERYVIYTTQLPDDPHNHAGFDAELKSRSAT